MVDIDYMDVKKYPRSDIGMAKMFHDAFADELLYCADVNEWYSWSGSNWRKDTCLYRCECAKKLYDECMKALVKRPDLIGDDVARKYYQRMSEKKIRDRIVEDARSISPVTSNMFDADKFLFNCKNGTYNFKTHAFKPHSKTDYLTRLSSVTYDSNAKCPRFEQYLEEVMQGDQRKIDYLMKIGAYCLTGDTSYECFFILYGDKTRNGKSTYVSTLTELMGNYAETVRPASITRKSMNTGGSGATPDIAKLHQSRLATVSELEDGMMLDISLIKTMTGNNMLAARELYSKEFKFVPQFKILVDTNYLPKMTDDSIFNSDRIHILCFDRHFEPEERDIHLKDTLRGEVDGIFNLFLYYYEKLEKEGFIMPTQTKETIRQYALTSNNVKQFVTDMIYPKAGCYERAGDVYKAYVDWCGENNYKVLGAKNFRQKLMDLGMVYTEKCRHRNDRGTYDNTIWIQHITLTEQDSYATVTRLPVDDPMEQKDLKSFMKEIDKGYEDFDFDELPFDDGDLPY